MGFGAYIIVNRTIGDEYKLGIAFLENLKEITTLIIFITCVIYRRELKLTKWKRKLTKGEMTMYLITSITIPIYAIAYLMLMFGVE